MHSYYTSTPIAKSIGYFLYRLLQVCALWWNKCKCELRTSTEARERSTQFDCFAPRSVMRKTALHRTYGANHYEIIEEAESNERKAVVHHDCPKLSGSWGLMRLWTWKSIKSGSRCTLPVGARVDPRSLTWARWVPQPRNVFPESVSIDLEKKLRNSPHDSIETRSTVGSLSNDQQTED